MKLGDGHFLELADVQVFPGRFFFLLINGLGFFLKLLVTWKTVGAFVALALAFALAFALGGLACFAGFLLGWFCLSHVLLTLSL